jgi:cellulose synthase operon protein C
VSKGTELKDNQLPTARLDPAAKSSVPLTTRLAIEIPKPKDWQAFQRNCVLLFRAELNDPHAQEYGRGGQPQSGIDILARRDGRDDYFVGVQCRLINRPLKEAKILADARAALMIEAGLKELIFATTAPDDSGASDAAVRVTRALKSEGHDITVVVYGWGQLQTLIAPHDVAYNVFHPSAVASAAPQATGPGPGSGDFAASIAEHVVEQLRGAGLTVVAPNGGVAVSTDEDLALHARIDTFRDLFKERQEPLLAEEGLLSLLEKEDLAGKPWARYRIETNLGSIAIDLGREAEAARRFEAAHAIRPDDPNALANLALARTIQGRFDEAMKAAQAALRAETRADHAVSYLLQAAARAAWNGEPESLIPEDLTGTAQADIGLAEFLRQREISGWAERTLEIARRHQDAPEFKRIRAIAVLSLAIDEGAIVPGGRGTVTTADLNTAADDMKALAEHCLAVGFADAYDLTAYLNNAAVLLRLCDRHKESESLLVRGLPSVGDEPQLRRLLALARVDQGREAEAIATLAGDADSENQILRAELQASTGDLTGALKHVVALDPTDLPVRLQLLRWRLLGELALRLGDDAQVSAAVAELRILDPHDLAASPHFSP